MFGLIASTLAKHSNGTLRVSHPMLSARRSNRPFRSARCSREREALINEEYFKSALLPPCPSAPQFAVLQIDVGTSIHRADDLLAFLAMQRTYAHPCASVTQFFRFELPIYRKRKKAAACFKYIGK